MNAVVNDNAVIGESAIVAAMAFVKAEMKVPPRTLVAGIPAKVVRVLTTMRSHGSAMLPGSTKILRCVSLRTMRETVALTEVEPGRKRFELGDVVTTFRMEGAVRPCSDESAAARTASFPRSTTLDESLSERNRHALREHSG